MAVYAIKVPRKRYESRRILYRGTLMSFTDYFVQRRLKSNTPIGMIESKHERSRA